MSTAKSLQLNSSNSSIIGESFELPFCSSLKIMSTDSELSLLKFSDLISQLYVPLDESEWKMPEFRISVEMVFIFFVFLSRKCLSTFSKCQTFKWKIIKFDIQICLSLFSSEEKPSIFELIRLTTSKSSNCEVLCPQMKWIMKEEKVTPSWQCLPVPFLCSNFNPISSRSYSKIILNISRATGNSLERREWRPTWPTNNGQISRPRAEIIIHFHQWPFIAHINTVLYPNKVLTFLALSLYIQPTARKVKSMTKGSTYR